MQKLTLKLLPLFLLFILSCKQNNETKLSIYNPKVNCIKHAKGIAMYQYDGFTVIKIKKPWPKATKDYTYILQKKNVIIPESLQHYPIIKVPIKTVVVTSTTHIASLEMLGVENTLVGFPNLNYISSPKVRSRIEAGKVKELGNNVSINFEAVINLHPSAVVGYGIDNNNPSLDNIQKSGLKVILNGDWNEQTPLGKAEWLKFFGALYGKEKLADTLYSKIEEDYHKTLALAKKTTTLPTILAGAMFEDTWYVPQGNSWGSLFLKDAKANYLWKNEKGTGGLALAFETVFEKAQNADFWIGPGQFTSLDEMIKTNPHYAQFKAFKTKKIYSYSIKKGKTGGIIYFELAPNRPDLVLKDLLKIMHPELLPNYELFFFERLQ
jgi:iron complex transport system substrate-binding protein